MLKGRYSHPGLASLRREAGVTIDQIMDATKLSRSFVKAIDEGEFEKLPGGIFTISYIRQYAESIGQDGDAILAEIRSALEGTSEVLPVRDETAPAMTRWARFFSVG